ncbi:MAG: hypothetical protein MJ159_03410 [Treponemataceae bacterium]|nr:hypothetical protein [Treponemataceae bacterium]
MGAVTEYGKQLRHLRLDLSELLGTMAEKPGLSPACLLSIETGSRSIPVDLTSKVIEVYNLSQESAKNLLKAAESAWNNANRKRHGFTVRTYDCHFSSFSYVH